MKLFPRTAQKIVTTFATTAVVAAVATAFAVASPLTTPCAAAEVPANISAAPVETAAFVTAINALRASKGLNTLIIDGNMTDIAQGWAQQMAQNDGISHRSDLRAGVTGNWKTLGENVGVGPGVQSLMDAFIASPGHYENLVDPRFTHLGVGSVRTTSGMLYTAHEFMALASTPAPVVTAPRVTTPPAPRVTTPRVTTPVTAPPTTVTTVPEPTTTTTLLVLPTEQHKLNDSGQNNQDEQADQSQGGCASHQASRLMALATGSVTR